MSKQLLIYDNAVPVTRQRHGNLSVKAGASFGFAATVNSVPLMAAEFGVPLVAGQPYHSLPTGGLIDVNAAGSGGDHPSGVKVPGIRRSRCQSVRRM